ncbi:hypothetical protein ACIRBZ_13935 [Streptomyces sp. NPDC094038]|uniref:hypothetical protein n=1 Tax=Streptomyces sp. NPDC094038 TaxID=3366055 RepID=UPI00382993D7
MVAGENGQHSALWEALKKLTNKFGVYRPDLLEALESELRPLKECWEVNVKSGRDVARVTITANLREHIGCLEVPRTTVEDLTAPQKEERFRNSVEVSFNVARKYWTNLDLKGRHAWLEKEAPKHLQMSISTSRRNLDKALDQIEQQILAAGYKPVPAEEMEVASSPNVSEEPAGLKAVRMASRSSSVPERIKRRSVLTAGIALVVLGGIAVWPLGVFSGHDSTKGEAEKTSTSLPLTATVAFTPDATQCDGWIFSNRQPDELPAAPAGGMTAAWAHEHGAVDAPTTRLKVTLQGKTSADVILTNLRVAEVKKEKPLSGTGVMLSAGCGGVIKDRIYRVALGATSPVMQLVVNHGDGTSSVSTTPVDYKVASDDPEVFSIQGDAFTEEKNFTGCSCTLSWKLAVDWSYKGRQGTLMIDDHGKPFQTADAGDGLVASVRDDGGKWVPM